VAAVEEDVVEREVAVGDDAADVRGHKGGQLGPDLGGGVALALVVAVRGVDENPGKCRAARRRRAGGRSVTGGESLLRFAGRRGSSNAAGVLKPGVAGAAPWKPGLLRFRWTDSAPGVFPRKETEDGAGISSGES
jgi:hypothetical protein